MNKEYVEKLYKSENLSVEQKLYNDVLQGETVLLDNTAQDKILYNKVCDMLDENEIDYVSGDIDPKYPEEQYYIELQ